MIFLRDYFKLGISPAMLYKNAFDNDAEHLYAFIKCCDMEEYEVIEAYLPHDAIIRNMEISYLKRSGKILNYNCPKELQMEAPYNAGSENAEYRRKAVEFTKLHINYAVDAKIKKGIAKRGTD